MFFTVKKVQRNEISGIYLVCFLLYIKPHMTSSQSTIFEKFWIKKFNSGLPDGRQSRLCLQPPLLSRQVPLDMAVNIDINYRTAHYIKRRL